MTRVFGTIVVADVFALPLHDEVQFVFAAIDQLFRFLQTQVVETGVIDLRGIRKRKAMFTKMFKRTAVCSDYRDYANSLRIAVIRLKACRESG